MQMPTSPVSWNVWAWASEARNLAGPKHPSPKCWSNITCVVVDQRLFFNFSTSKLGEMVQFDSCFFKWVETNKY